jgi:hypothetical protein
MSYVALATTTLGSSASSVTFSSIPATYRDLIVVVAGTLTTSVAGIEIQLNADTTASNYNHVYMLGRGSGSGEADAANNNLAFFMQSAQSVSILQFMDYSATDKHKTYLSRANPSANYTVALAGRWANTAAVNAIKLLDTAGSASFASGTVISLYGVAA